MWSRHRQQQQCGAQFRPPPRERGRAEAAGEAPAARERDGVAVSEDE